MWILLYPRDLCGPPSAPSAHPLCRGACVHLTQFLRSTLCVMGLVCSCLTSWPRALCSGDCVHVIRLPWPASASRGLVWTCSSSPRPSSTLWGLCTLVSSHCSHSLSWGLFVLLLAVPGGTCALPKFICLPLSAPQSHPLRRLFVGRHTRLPGPALCAARVVCAG